MANQSHPTGIYPICIQLHDYPVSRPVILKWLEALAYSNNIKLDISPAIKTAVDRLAELCFSRHIRQNVEANQLQSIDAFYQCVSPQFYFYVLKSMEKRLIMAPGAAHILFNE